MTTKDLDSDHYGTALNGVADEWIGDIEASFTVTEIAGTVDVLLHKGDAERVVLQLTEDSWAVMLNDKRIAHGTGQQTGASWSIRCLDNLLTVTLAGEKVATEALKPLDPNQHRRGWELSGDGVIALAGLRLNRDMHFCANGFPRRRKFVVL